MSYRILFCGTPEFAIPSLAAVSAHSSCEVVRVYSQPDRPSGRGQKLQPSPVKIKAQELGLEVRTPEKIVTDEELKDIKSLGCDLAVVVAYGQILSQDFLNLFPHGAVNIHSSLLPRWRGAAPMQRAIMEGDSETGVSLQRVVRKLDAGDVIAEKKIQLTINMGARELHDRLSVLGAELLVETLPAYLTGQIDLKVQNHDQVTYAKKIEKAEAFIDWQQSAFRIHNKIRGLNLGGPFATARFRNQTIKIHQSLFVADGAHQGHPGEVIDLSPTSIRVACGLDAIEILRVQPENKAAMSAADFLRGYRLSKGERFE